MTSTRDLLDEVLRTRSGSLEQTPYPILLLAIATQQKSAVLELHRNQLEKTILFDDGSPVECRSNIATETLGRTLVASGKVAEADCHAAFAVAASRGVPLGEILTERKLIAPTELYRALQQNLGRKLLEPFSWKNGTWTISFDVPPAASVLRVKVPQLLVTGIMKIEAQEIADEAVAVANGKFLALASEPLFGLDEIRVTREQQTIVDAARRGGKFDDLRGAVDTDDLHRFVYALMLLGILQITDHSMPEAPKLEVVNPFVTVEPERPAPIREAPVMTFEAAAIPEIEPASAEEVMEAYLAYRRKDAFDLLQIAETDGGPAAAKAFLEISDRFLPSKFEGNGDGVHDKAQEVFLAAARAYAEIADPQRREALVARREKLREEAAATAKLGAAALIDPEALCKSGRTLMAAGKLREALSSFEMAADCDAQNGTYAAEAAWCRYQLGVTPAANAIKLLKNAIRIDPSSGVAHLYAGQVMALMGHRLEGQAYVSRAASLLPGDPRPAQAMKSLQR